MGFSNAQIIVQIIKLRIRFPRKARVLKVRGAGDIFENYIFESWYLAFCDIFEN